MINSKYISGLYLLLDHAQEKEDQEGSKDYPLVNSVQGKWISGGN